MNLLDLIHYQYARYAEASLPLLLKLKLADELHQRLWAAESPFDVKAISEAEPPSPHWAEPNKDPMMEIGAYGETCRYLHPVQQIVQITRLLWFGPLEPCESIRAWTKLKEFRTRAVCVLGERERLSLHWFLDSDPHLDLLESALGAAGVVLKGARAARPEAREYLAAFARKVSHLVWSSDDALQTVETFWHAVEVCPYRSIRADIRYHLSSDARCQWVPFEELLRHGQKPTFSKIQSSSDVICPEAAPLPQIEALLSAPSA